MTDLIPWAAGLFEGEGSISTQTTCAYGNLRVRVRFTMAVTDLDVLERFRAAVGRGTITGPFRYEKSTRDIWRWQVSSRQDVAVLAQMFRPYLGRRRLATLDRCLADFEAQPPPAHRNRDRTHCKRGHEFTPENTRVETSGSRRCLQCERAREATRGAEV